LLLAHRHDDAGRADGVGDRATADLDDAHGSRATLGATARLMPQRGQQHQQARADGSQAALATAALQAGNDRLGSMAMQARIPAWCNR
jgi:hypothetical protein